MGSEMCIRDRYSPTVMVFADAARPSTDGQLGFLLGLLLGPLEVGSVFHLLSWSSHLSKRPANSSTCAETMAAGKAVEGGRSIAATFSRLLNRNVRLWVAVDSKDLFHSLSSHRSPEDKSNEADVQLLRYYFETK